MLYRSDHCQTRRRLGDRRAQNSSLTLDIDQIYKKPRRLLFPDENSLSRVFWDPGPNPKHPGQQVFDRILVTYLPRDVAFTFGDRGCRDAGRAP
jgi:hypothetical protein